MDKNLSASLVIQNKNNVWVNDNMVTNCAGCHAEFGMWVRKHHCRNCGNIFCYECSNYSSVIPKFITDRPDPADYWNISHYLKMLRGKRARVCELCYLTIDEKIKSYDKMVKVFADPVPIDQIKNLSDANMDVKTHYYDHFRNIQYYLPNHQYSALDKKLLKINGHFFGCHSKYIMHLIKSLNWNDPEMDAISQLEFILAILSGEKTISCSELFCTRTCRDTLSCDDCINILYSKYRILPNELISYLFEVIKQTSEEVILCNLPFFINLVKDNNFSKQIQISLLELLSTSEKMIYYTYWFLMVAKEDSTILQIKNINSFVELLSPDFIKIIDSGRKFFVGLINNLDDPKKYLMENFREMTLPYDPSIKILSVDFENISIKTSFTKPVMIPFETTQGKINLLFKRESIINDVTVLNLMTLSDIILRDTLQINLGCMIYPVMPITSSSGMIQIIDNAETVYSIGNKKKTIFQYICEKNEDKIIGDIMNKYLYSLVSYTLHSYFIGLGDRHLQNIMISHDGTIFHIDFGFILGTDAVPLGSTEIKLNYDMLEVIGGNDSTRYKQYLDICSHGVIVLRKYFNLFFILLAQNVKFKERHIQRFIMSRFQPRQNDTAVIAELMTVIEKSNNSYSALVRDFLHYHTQEKTVQHGIGKVFKTAYTVVKGFKSLGENKEEHEI